MRVCIDIGTNLDFELMQEYLSNCLYDVEEVDYFSVMEEASNDKE